MHRLATIAFSLLAACGFAIPVSAQTQPFVPPTPGTTVFLSSGGYFEADSVDGTTVRFVNAALTQYDLVGGCYVPDRKAAYDHFAIDKLWPLAPGNSATIETGIGDRRWSVIFRVVGQQQIRTQAGTFNAWLITVDETALTHAFRGVYQCWYAPEIGMPVKRHKDIKAGQGAGFDQEAVRIEKRDRSKVAEFRSPKPGTGFNVTTGFVRIESTKGRNLFQPYSGPNGKLVWVSGLRQAILPDYYGDALDADMNKIWPLEVGKSVDFQGQLPAYRPGDTSTYHFEAKVDRTEVVTVPAGTFSTFVIKWRERGMGLNTFDGTLTFWWSPALGFPVKQQAHIVTGVTNWKNFELLNTVVPR